MGNTDSSTGRTWIIEWRNPRWPEHKWDTNSKEGFCEYYTQNEAKERLNRDQRWFPDLPHKMTNTAPSTVKGDMKEGLTNGKPQLSQIPHAAQVYASRSFEYGSQKYERGNYLRPTVDRLADFDRLASYLDAALRHITKVTTEMNRARGCTDKSEIDLKTAAACIDVESGLPHLCGAMCSIMMAVQQAVDAGLIPADPGQPWLKKTK